MEPYIAWSLKGHRHNSALLTKYHVPASSRHQMGSIPKLINPELEVALMKIADEHTYSRVHPEEVKTGKENAISLETVRRIHPLSRPAEKM